MSYTQVPDTSAAGFHRASHDKPAPIASDFGVALTAGKIEGREFIVKFGRNESAGTSYVPLCGGGIWATPQASGATTLRIKAGGNANDTAAGSGAREIMIEGVDAAGNFISEAVATNGASASLVTSQSFLRIRRAYVSKSGTYGTVSALSHAGTITIENSAGSQDWATISAANVALGQTSIGAFTVPLGYKGYLQGIAVSGESTKATSVVGMVRSGILDAAAPYQAMRTIFAFDGIQSPLTVPIGGAVELPALSDLIFFGKITSGTGAIGVNFTIILVKQ